MNSAQEQAFSHYSDGVKRNIVPVNDTLEKALDAAVADFPHRVAIDFLGREFTYVDILEQVKRAATVLTMCGVRRGDVVSLILPNCPQHYIAFYAATYLGATVSEHNPLAPPAQLLEQLKSNGARIVIAWEQTIEKLTENTSLHGFTYLAVDITRALPRKSQFLLKLPLKAAKTQRAKLRGKVPPGVHSWDNQVSHAAPMNLGSLKGPELDDIAVLIQTGGTTGSPKAVQLSHRNIVSNARQVEYWLTDFKRGEETVAAVLPFFHAFGLQLSLSVCVSMAATQVMTPSFDVDILLAAHSRHPITFFGGVPPMFDKILKAIEKRPEVDLRSIRFSVSGAMPLAPELAKRWEDTTGGFMIEGYGMSEASPVIAGSPYSEQRRPSTLGLPFPSTEVMIVDPEDPDKQVADGEVGEILVRGPQVFAGYHNNPEETANVMWNGWLRTGDLARWDDGFLVMADRKKELIINGGFNVYPSEVESAVRDMPGVVDVAVVGMPADSFGESVVAALVLEPGAKVDLEAVRRWTEGKLSHYAMPKSIAIFDDLPRSQLGKVMRKNVKEQLQHFELSSGQWRQKLSDASSAASARFDSYLQSIHSLSGATQEQLKAWSEANSAQLDRLKTWVNEHTPTTEEMRSFAESNGITVENFKTWIAQLTTSKPSEDQETESGDDKPVAEDGNEPAAEATTSNATQSTKAEKEHPINDAKDAK
ncbi:AMP-binding protein [Arcanobacterium bovis]|uniref:Long-chain fatty acid--CoA ligase n=1 Tax=Arcanobacterium bovis TaxID=2529275 RepID=A0A4Q9V109_9ACTO|nr:AMP-binding protein [Arcanobacterium bovis]TBW22751.1 long-chain fatty acid--CoA ligase [Arcanobacterium bovis]